jgi:choline dehydrogenase-like flavoprotein
MARCTVIGSGPSAVHFALSALQAGHHVDMIDVGRTSPQVVNPGDSFAQLKENLEDPVSYFLGTNYEGVLLPGEQEEFYGIPPSKNYALESVSQLQVDARDFSPMFSFAQGGLAQMWTGGCYPFNDAELEDFPFGYDELAPFYSQVSQRIGINGRADDDLARFTPSHEGLLDPLQLDEHSALLLSRYDKKRQSIQKEFGCFMGRARHSVLSRDQGARKACQYLGRCLWGCPSGALYTPSITLEECMKHQNFSYHGDHYASHFEYSEHGKIDCIVAESTSDGTVRRFPIETLVLAAGTLGTSKIFLQSIYRKTGRVEQLHGLMDNRQVMVPFVNLKMIGRPYNPDSYQYNQLALGLEEGRAREYVHGMITTLKTAMIHPVLEKFPFDLRTSLQLFRNVHAALGVVNLNFHDTRRQDNYVTLDTTTDAMHPRLVVNYVPPGDEAVRTTRALKRLKKVLWKLGCIVPPGMTYVRPMGASVHYAGTLPMSVAGGARTVTQSCRSNDFDNLYLADGATYPFLPAKNITFTLMANASRIAHGLAEVLNN